MISANLGASLLSGSLWLLPLLFHEILTKSCEVGTESISYLHPTDVEIKASECKFLSQQMKELGLLYTSFQTRLFPPGSELRLAAVMESRERLPPASKNSESTPHHLLHVKATSRIAVF